MPNIIASPATDIDKAVLGNALWGELLIHCYNNVDKTLLYTGINENKNLFLGKYYNSLTGQPPIKPPFEIYDELTLEKFKNKDVYFIRSFDLPSAKTMSYFTICMVFLPPHEESRTNGTYTSHNVGYYPTIIVYIADWLVYRSNVNKIKEAFANLNHSVKHKSIFMHEFTHLLDDKTYDINKIFIKQTTKSFKEDYVNFNHEINARYMQIVLAILNKVHVINVVKKQTLAKAFPTFQEFYRFFWENKETSVVPPLLYKYISDNNKKRLQTRLYSFYRYMIEQEIKHHLNKQNSIEFAKDQVIDS